MRKLFRFIRYISLMLICICLALIGGFFIRRHLERQKQLQIMADFESRIINELTAADHIYTGGSHNDYVSVEGQTLAILRLDRLNIKVSVAEGIDKDTLRLSVGHFPGTGMPGDGNFAIAGHSSMVYTCLFNDMHKAVLGDVITVTTRTDKHEYVITDILVVEPTETELIAATNESVITIVTCTNSGKERLILRGVEV